MAFYKIVAAPRVYKDIKKIPKDIAKDVSTAIAELANTPRPQNCKKLKGCRGDEYRLKVRRDYRVLYEIFDSEKIVYVLRVLNRKDAYRSF